MKKLFVLLLTFFCCLPTWAATGYTPPPGVSTLTNADGTIQLVQSGSSYSVSLMSLADTYILVGNGSSIASAVAISGDATLSDLGVLTLATVNGSGGTCTSCNLTTDAKGRIIAFADGSSGGGGFTANTVASSGSTNMVAQNAYFITATSGTCTMVLPDATAAGVAGQEIIVFLIASGATVTFDTTSSQTISGQASGAISSTVEYNGYRFIADGANWQLE